jgi:hypothetical protein
MESFINSYSFHENTICVCALKREKNEVKVRQLHLGKASEICLQWSHKLAAARK